MVELLVEEEAKGLELPIEGVKLPLEEQVESFFFNISHFNFFIYVSCDFLPRSFLVGFFITCFEVLYIFILNMI